MIKEIFNLLGRSFLQKCISLGALSSIAATLEILSFMSLANLLNQLIVNGRINAKVLIEVPFLPPLDLSKYILLMLCLFTISLLTNILINYIVINTAQNFRVIVSSKILKSFFEAKVYGLKKLDADDLTKEIVSETDTIVNYLVSPIINLVHSIILVFAFISYVFFQHGSKILLPILSIIFSYIVLFIITKSFVSKSAELRDLANTNRFKGVSESIRGYRDLITYNGKDRAVSIIKKSFQDFSHAISIHNILAKIPRFYVEYLIVIISIYFVYQSMSNPADYSELIIVQLVPSILAILKCITPCQNIFNSVLSLRFAKSPLRRLSKLIDLEGKKTGLENLNSFVKIKLTDVCYEVDSITVLESVNLEIKDGEKVLIVGPSGAGKSTLLDIISGFKNPSKGKVTLQFASNNNVSTHPSYFSYVQQTPFIFEGNFFQNISVDLNKVISDIDNDQMLESLKFSDLSNKQVKRELYRKKIESYGINLSGGQKQRISIARAIYNSNAVLILDEFSSALHGASRTLIYENIKNSDRTIIATSHDENAKKYFDRVICLPHQ